MKSVHKLTSFLLVLITFLTLGLSTVNAAPIRLGIIGDSNSDEYRADDNRAGGTSYAQTTLNWAELLVNRRGFSMGAWGSWGGERRSGYEFNWARSGATTGSMISNGQHTGLASQIAAGKIDYAIIFVGINDFHTWNGTYGEIYNGTLSDAAVTSKVNSIVSGITTAVDTLKNAGPVKIILVSYADPGVAVDFRTQYPDAAKRQRVTNAITSINQRLTTMASSKGVVIADQNNFATTLLSRVNSSGNLIIGGQTINILVHGYAPNYLQLADSVGHLGTVGNGLIANFILESLRRSGASVSDFSDAEILGYAGLGPVPTTPTPLPSGNPTPACNADINQDGTVDLSDYTLLIKNFLKTSISPARADISKDGSVDLSDYSLLVTSFFRPCP